MFSVNSETGAVTMHRGDTGSFKVHASRTSGDAWTANDRMLLTVKNGNDVVLQRAYRLDTALGNGWALIQFYNGDTDTWGAGTYQMERRYLVNPSWTGTVPTGDVTDMLTSESQMNSGDIVRTPNGCQTTLTILPVYGEV